MTYKDLGTALRKLGQNPTESELEEMIRTCEGINEGMLHFFRLTVGNKTQSHDVSTVEIYLTANPHNSTTIMRLYNTKVPGT